MTRIRIYPYKNGSRSALALSRELGALRLRRQGSRFRPRPDDVIINWGSSDANPPSSGRLLNGNRAVAIAANKLRFFQTVSAQESARSHVPEYWTARQNVDAYPVVCRTILTGHSGAGIVIANDESELVDAPLYVRYIKKQDEYRIHVGGGHVISTQRKARRLDVPDEDVNWQVRNHANGFIFARGNVVPPEQVLEAARSVVASLGLDFGAADVIWNSHTQRAYVLEVNTAPGLEGTTVEDYARYFRSVIEEANGSGATPVLESHHAG